MRGRSPFADSFLLCLVEADRSPSRVRAERWARWSMAQRAPSPKEAGVCTDSLRTQLFEVEAVSGGLMEQSSGSCGSNLNPWLEGQGSRFNQPVQEEHANAELSPFAPPTGLLGSRKWSPDETTFTVSSESGVVPIPPNESEARASSSLARPVPTKVPVHALLSSLRADWRFGWHFPCPRARPRSSRICSRSLEPGSLGPNHCCS